MPFILTGDTSEHGSPAPVLVLDSNDQQVLVHPNSLASGDVIVFANRGLATSAAARMALPLELVELTAIENDNLGRFDMRSVIAREKISSKVRQV